MQVRTISADEEIIRVSLDTLFDERPDVVSPETSLWSIVATRADGAEQILCQAESALEVTQLFHSGRITSFPGTGSHMTKHLAVRIDLRSPEGEVVKVVKQKPAV